MEGARALFAPLKYAPEDERNPSVARQLTRPDRIARLLTWTDADNGNLHVVITSRV